MVQWLFLFCLTCVWSVPDIVPDTVPDTVDCKKVKICDQNKICAIVCERGTVVTNVWQRAVLHFQRQATYLNTICNLQLPGTHNSGINIADGYGVEDHYFEKLLHWLPYTASDRIATNNQLFSLTDQLNMGVRFLEIDVHWFDHDLHVAHCGGFHGKLLNDFVAGINWVAKYLGIQVQWDSETIGCKPSLSSIPASEQRRVEDAIQEVAAWLKLHTDEFLVLFFDDQADLAKWDKVKNLLIYLNQHIPTSTIFTPKDYARNNNTWPSAKSLILQHQRILVLSGQNYGKAAEHVMFYKPNVCNWSEPSLPLVPFPKCTFTDSNTSAISNNVIIRPISNEIVYGPLNGEGQIGPNHNLIDENSLQHMYKCGISMVSPDNMTPKRMEATIWSYDVNEFPSNDKCTVAPFNNRTSSFRWKGSSCTLNTTQAFGVACKQIEGHFWVIGKLVNSHQVATNACPDRYYYSVPRSGYENQLLKQAAILDTRQFGAIWLNVKDLQITQLEDTAQMA